MFIKYCVLPANVVIFLNSASSAAAPVFDLPLCTLIEIEGKPIEARVGNISSKKNTIFNEHSVCMEKRTDMLVGGTGSAGSSSALGLDQSLGLLSLLQEQVGVQVQV